MLVERVSAKLLKIKKFPFQIYSLLTKHFFNYIKLIKTLYLIEKMMLLLLNLLLDLDLSRTENFTYIFFE